MNAVVHNFDFEGHGVRMQMLRDEPWFVLADVCRVLDINNARQAATRLDDDEKGVITNDTLGGKQEMTVISESGLYSLILTSRKEEAKRFKKWVTSEVLPAIRRTGFYMADVGHEFPLTIDGKVFGLPVAKVNAAARLVAVAKGIYGPEAARALWESDRTLPKLTGLMHCYLDGIDEDTPIGCFKHLMRSAGYKTATVGEMLHLALTDRTMNSKMHHYGILAGAVGSGDHIAFAHQHPFLARVFADTCWVGDWKLALIKLPGATQTRTQLQFGPVKSKAVLLPRDEFLKLYLS
jgi:hypothetical protein